MSNIEAGILQSSSADPSDLSYLTAHLRELSPDAVKYLIWASFFGST